MARRLSFLVSLAITVGSMMQHLAKADVPAIFIFGDSTADVGTNNNLKNTRARADKPYNGIDFPYSIPTGRFSNGYNTADFIARLLGSKRSPPPFLSLLNNMRSFKPKILRGVNFASGGSGILDDTGNKTFMEVVPLGEQIQQFKTVCGNITEVLGPSKGNYLLSNSMYFISVGSNDIFDYERSNLFMPPQKLITTLHDTYANHLKNLYNLGARKFGIVSVPPIGCCPYQRALKHDENGGCFQKLNDLAFAFYNSIDDLLKKFSSEFQGVKYSFGNAYALTMNIIDNPLAFHFKEIKAACCGNGMLNGEYPCSLEGNLCVDRRDHLFWDRFHPTEAASELAALTLYGGGSEFVAPMNFSQLATIEI